MLLLWLLQATACHNYNLHVLQSQQHVYSIQQENVLLVAGFTSKQAHKIGIPSIGIVAVLVANVTFIAWATPPGL